MTKNSDDGKHAMIFVFTDCWEVIFWRKKRGKTPIFHIYRPLPYSSRDGENMLTSCPPPVEITPNIRPRRHPPSLKSPNAILELSDANFAEVFGVILTDGVTWREHVFPVPGPGTSTVRVYKYEKWYFSSFFSSKNDFSTVCKYEKHCMFLVITVFCHN